MPQVDGTSFNCPDVVIIEIRIKKYKPKIIGQSFEFALPLQHETSRDSEIQTKEYFKSKSRKRLRSLITVSWNSNDWYEYWNTKSRITCIWDRTISVITEDSWPTWATEQIPMWKLAALRRFKAPVLWLQGDSGHPCGFRHPSWEVLATGLPFHIPASLKKLHWLLT